MRLVPVQVPSDGDDARQGGRGGGLVVHVDDHDAVRIGDLAGGGIDLHVEQAEGGFATQPGGQARRRRGRGCRPGRPGHPGPLRLPPRPRRRRGRSLPVASPRSSVRAPGSNAAKASTRRCRSGTALRSRPTYTWALSGRPTAESPGLLPVPVSAAIPGCRPGRGSRRAGGLVAGGAVGVVVKTESSSPHPATTRSRAPQMMQKAEAAVGRAARSGSSEPCCRPSGFGVVFRQASPRPCLSTDRSQRAGVVAEEEAGSHPFHGDGPQHPAVHAARRRGCRPAPTSPRRPGPPGPRPRRARRRPA